MYHKIYALSPQNRWTAILTSVFMLIVGIQLSILSSATMIILGIPAITLSFSILFFMRKRLFYPLLTIYEDHFVLENEHQKLFYKNIETVFLKKDQNEFYLTIKHKALDTKDSSNNYEITYPLGKIFEFDTEKLESILNAKINDENINLISLFNSGNSSNNQYIPNVISLKTRVLSFIAIVGLTLYVVYSLIVGKIMLPAKRGVLVLQGLPMYIVVVAFLLWSIRISAIIIDHYDKRNNEYTYKKFGVFIEILAFGIFLLGILFGMIRM